MLGGTQSLHTNGYDEAFSLPTEEAARIALRTQQIIGYESGVTDTVDPLAGSYFMEALTNELEQAAQQYIDKIDAMGGSVKAIEAGYMQEEIAHAAYEFQKGIKLGEKVLVGVNKFTVEENATVATFRISDEIRNVQSEKLAALRQTRDNEKVNHWLSEIERCARDGSNLMPAVVEAVDQYATLGEIADVLRGVFGEYTGN